MTERKTDPIDPKGLIREAFRIDGIGLPECRSIFLDWALSVEEAQVAMAVGALLRRYADMPEDHPMRAVLQEAQATPTAIGRRGGRKARLPDG